MKLSVRRFEYGTNYTVGRLYINDSPNLFCYTMEDVVRPKGEKIFGKTAIPAGHYEVKVDFSPHFGKKMPHILDVPMFSGVRIHSGNDDADTEGCILVGFTHSSGDWVGDSRKAFDRLFPQIEEAYNNKESITIDIIDTRRDNAEGK